MSSRALVPAALLFRIDRSIATDDYGSALSSTLTHSYPLVMALR